MLSAMAEGRKEIGEGGVLGQRSRPISISLAPLKSAVFGSWYDQVRPLLRRRAGCKFELPPPVYTEVCSV